jgi:hypothetical protein
MLGRASMTVSGAVGALALALCCTLAPAWAFDDSKYPDFVGQWRKPNGVTVQWDQTKALGLAQQAPLKPEFQAELEASLKDQGLGGQGVDARYTCLPNGMPRIMTVVWPIEIVITPKITYMLFENNLPRRIFTDGRAVPTNEEPSFNGYSIGKWIDSTGSGRYDTLEIETRNLKGPRTFEASGIMMHPDNETVVNERMYLDPRDHNVLHNDITTTDHALTRPWTVNKRYLRVEEKKVIFYENECSENNQHVIIGKEGYYMSADGYLMPVKKGQKPPDLRYFKETQK